MVELDLPELEPCNERIDNAVYFTMNSDEFRGDEACLPFLDHLAKLVAKDHECRSGFEAKRQLFGLDIGANIGAVVPLVIECCGGNAGGGAVPVHVVAFEPNPANLPQLESEVRRLHTDPRLTVSVCTTVASDAAGPVRFHVNRKNNFAGNQHGSVHYFEGEYAKEDRDVQGGDSSAFLELAADMVAGGGRAAARRPTAAGRRGWRWLLASAGALPWTL